MPDSSNYNSSKLIMKQKWKSNQINEIHFCDLCWQQRRLPAMPWNSDMHRLDWWAYLATSLASNASIVRWTCALIVAGVVCKRALANDSMTLNWLVGWHDYADYGPTWLVRWMHTLSFPHFLPLSILHSSHSSHSRTRQFTVSIYRITRTQTIWDGWFYQIRRKSHAFN